MIQILAPMDVLNLSHFVGEPVIRLKMRPLDRPDRNAD
jgi:hypothetical protein